MTHLDDESMALFAMGEAVPDVEQRQHIEHCARCDAELSSLTRLVGVGRASRDAEVLPPPASVWNRIHAELGLSDAVAEVPGEGTSIARVPAAPEKPAPPVAPAVDSAEAPRANVTPIRRVQTTVTRWSMVAAALVVGVVAGVVGSTVITPSSSQTVLAEAVLEPFPNWSASGSARVEEDASGARDVVVDLSAPGDGLREVWLIDPETSGLVSLGLLSGASGTFSIPSNIDLGRYSVVDVSEEPDDGNPAHSGDSIVRGQLSTV